MPQLAGPGIQPRTRRELVRTPLLTIGSLAAATVALRLRDPHQEYSWGLCPSAALGLDCPFCGGLRAVNDLTHAQVLQAASSNLVLVAAMPIAIVLLGLWLLDRWRGHDRGFAWFVPRGAWLASIAVLVVFTVLRNLPAGGWLAS